MPLPANKRQGILFDNFASFAYSLFDCSYIGIEKFLTPIKNIIRDRVNRICLPAK